MPNPSQDRSERLAALRAQVRAIESAGVGPARDCLPFGVDAIDRRLAGGGLVTPGLHEIAGAGAALSDDAAATLFLVGIAARLGGGAGTVLWALSRRDLFAPGLALGGLGPGRVLYAECRGDEEVLAVMEEGLRHRGLAAVVGEVGRAAMSSTRRLQLACEEGATTALMLKRWRRAEDPLAAPSAALTRWRIASAPSTPLPVEGIGRARWHVELARQRGGEPFTLLMEGTDAQGRLALPAELRDRPDQTGGTEQRAAA
ncbi:MAG TPA: protein ImuA [Allosphingosinicella sp.]|jgi:protein ImuA